MVIPYTDIVDLKYAIEENIIMAADLIVINHEGQLIIRDSKDNDLFVAYYGSYRACTDICRLVGINKEPQKL